MNYIFLIPKKNQIYTFNSFSKKNIKIIHSKMMYHLLKKKLISLKSTKILPFMVKKKLKNCT